MILFIWNLLYILYGTTSIYLFLLIFLLQILIYENLYFLEDKFTSVIVWTACLKDLYSFFNQVCNCIRSCVIPVMTSVDGVLRQIENYQDVPSSPKADEVSDALKNVKNGPVSPSKSRVKRSDTKDENCTV